MAIPNINEQDIIKALKYIDDNGVPSQNQSTKYELVSEDGKKYPVKYVVAVAEHIANGSDIVTSGYNSIEVKNFLKAHGFKIEIKQLEEFELTITANKIVSTDVQFTTDNLSLGDGHVPTDAYFKRADGTIVRRVYDKGERRNSNMTLPRIACQVFENQISALSAGDKKNFPVCRYSPSRQMISGIYPSVEEFRKYRNTLEYMTYNCKDGSKFVIYSWNIFSTLLFVQECLKRFGKDEDQFVLTYREEYEDEKGKVTPPEQVSSVKDIPNESAPQFSSVIKQYSSMLIESKNLILRGAPGTGKSYLAKKIAAYIITNGCSDDYISLTDEQKKQVEFVQFHPSYDYTDFVEGLRPKVNDDGTMGFELKDGIFKKFVSRARKNLEDSRKTKETIEKEISVQEAMSEFFSNIELGVDTFKTINENEFTITSVDDDHVYISIPANASANKLTLNLDDIRRMLESGKVFDKIIDVTTFFGKTFAVQGYSYDFIIYKEILKLKNKTTKSKAKVEEQKNYVFIIDEINRGEISKIFGELFYSIDPGYRGEDGAISTQYSNLHSNPDEKFFIPENVYIIGTMNDIDRSVDSFDFAMRRRFRFVELRANEHLEMLDSLENEELRAEAISRMIALNNEIASVDDLNENYQIGASYFLKLKTLSFDQLWTDYLKPLLQEYIQGMYDEKGLMEKFAKAYGYGEKLKGDVNGTAQNQG
jgi:5-methylcytosine-specific restriction protein B